MRAERKVLSDLFPLALELPQLSDYQWKKQVFKRGDILFRPGKPCERFMLAGAGRVRVDLQNPQGRSITLYRTEPGQLCIHSLINLISDDVYSYVATAETDGWFCWADKQQFNLWMRHSETFQHWIFNNIGGRFKQVIDGFAQQSFVPVEKRLAELLIEKLGPEQTIKITQAELASELGTAREIVSRQLSRWQKEGWISTGRGQIDVLSFEMLLQASD